MGTSCILITPAKGSGQLGATTDFALQIEALAGFSAIIDRLGEFSEVVESFASRDQDAADAAANGSSLPQRIELVDVPTATQQSPAGQPLLRLEGVTLQIPDGSRTLVEGLDVEVLPPLLSVQAANLPRTISVAVTGFKRAMVHDRL